MIPIGKFLAQDDPLPGPTLALIARTWNGSALCSTNACSDIGSGAYLKRIKKTRKLLTRVK
jgi:hypothetical protein